MVEDKAATPTKDELREYEEISKARDPLTQLAKRFAPNLIGLDRPKRVLCLSMASCDDAFGSRGRIHVLIHGAPGGAKSSLIETAAAEANTETLSPRMSPGSFTIDFRNRQVGALGAMHDTEFQLLVIDEFEKLPRDMYKHFLRVMEEGILAVPGPGGVESIPAHLRVIAAANVIDEIAPELLDRFDYRLRIALPKMDDVYRIVDGMTQTFRSPTRSTRQVQYGFVRGYLRWIRDQNPDFSPIERTLSSRVMQTVVHAQKGEQPRLRGYEGVYRTAFAMARIRREPVTAERVMEAVQFVHHERDWSEPFGRLRDALPIMRRHQSTAKVETP